MFQIEGQRTLSRVLGKEGNPHSLFIQFRISPQLTGQVPSTRDLDLDHLCTQMRELVAAEGTCQDIRQIQNPKRL